MGSAEDAIRRRRRAADERTKAERHEAGARKAAHVADLITRVEALVPAALKGLHAAGWPEGELLRVRGLIGRKEIAGFRAGGFLFRHKDHLGTYIVPIYLLRDGRWYDASGRRPTGFTPVARRYVDWDGPRGYLMEELPVGVEEALVRFASYAPREGGQGTSGRPISQ